MTSNEKCIVRYLKISNITIYALIGKQFGKCNFFWNLGVGDIPVDGFSNKNFTLVNFVAKGFPNELRN